MCMCIQLFYMYIYIYVYIYIYIFFNRDNYCTKIKHTATIQQNSAGPGGQMTKIHMDLCLSDFVH